MSAAPGARCGVSLVVGLLLSTAGCDGCGGAAGAIADAELFQARHRNTPRCFYNNECKASAVTCPLPSSGPVCYHDPRWINATEGFCQCLSFSWPEDAGSMYASDAGTQYWCSPRSCGNVIDDRIK